MKTPNFCATLTIFEGPDGSGKSTAARKYAEATGARYVHLSSLPGVAVNLARVYVEAMLPALLGYQNVVLDRCWLSEAPYGVAFRDGRDRLGTDAVRMLERVAFRCNPVLVLCLPPFETVKANFMSRKEIEMLENEEQLKTVYDLYEQGKTSLPMVFYDYTTMAATDDAFLHNLIALQRTNSDPHLVAVPSAGNTRGTVVLVGDEFGEVKDCDSFIQFPFVSFSHVGCSRWLSARLAQAEVKEDNLFWLNSSTPAELTVAKAMSAHKTVVALGVLAMNRLKDCDIRVDHTVPHPQSWKRFHSRDPYALTALLRRFQ